MKITEQKKMQERYEKVSIFLENNTKELYLEELILNRLK